MQTQELLRAQYRQANGVLEQVIDDCEAETLAHVPGGNIGTIGSIYAHTVFDQDGMFQGAGREGSIWRSGDWAEKTGLGEMSGRQTEEWARTAHDMNLAAVREYAQEVYAATDAYLAGLSDEDLSEEIETFAGKQPRGQYLGTICLWHIINHQGEIAALKGAMGLKGLPF